MSDDANSTNEPDVAFLSTIVKAIVDNPDDIIVERSVDDLGVLIKLRVNEADMSKIVGKEGRTAKALRTLLRLVGSKFDQRINLKILEPDGSERRIEKEIETKAPAQTAAPTAAKDIPTQKEKLAATDDTAAGAFDNII
jgi:uncharacterized protein